MKIFFLFVLLFLVSCSGDKGEGKTISGQVTSGNIAEEQAAKEYIQQSIQTLPSELKISNEDKTNLKAELELTAEEAQSLDQL